MKSNTPFPEAFNERMKALGLPVAPEPFDNFPDAVSNASQMAAVVGLLNDGDSVAELVSRTLGLEKLMMASAYNARAYTAGIISCLAFASGEVRAGGPVMGELFRFTFQHRLQFPGWKLVFMMNPALTDATTQSAHLYGHRARKST